MAELEQGALPVHIGIIMDGNGRWAKKRGLPRKMGHIQGARTFRRCVDDCIDLGLRYVTFYAFSTENWKRPKDEVDGIMRLFDKYLDEFIEISKRNARLLFIGDRTPLSVSLQKKMRICEEESAVNTGLTCCIAVNYGGKDEIVHAVKKAVQLCKDGQLSEEQIDSFTFSKLMYAGIPDCDLIIRPSGEQRTSNFLIWQAAYAELVFMDVLWPDFSKDNLIEALNEYMRRNRRFGGV